MIPTDWQEYLEGLIGEYDIIDVESLVQEILACYTLEGERMWQNNLHY
jgi:hypothetical protein